MTLKRILINPNLLFSVHPKSFLWKVSHSVRQTSLCCPKNHSLGKRWRTRKELQFLLQFGRNAHWENVSFTNWVNKAYWEKIQFLLQLEWKKLIWKNYNLFYNFGAIGSQTTNCNQTSVWSLNVFDGTKQTTSTRVLFHPNLTRVLLMKNQTTNPRECRLLKNSESVQNLCVKSV